MTQLTKRLYTPEEYLALEETAEYKSEYYRGEIFAKAGGSITHNIIANNVNNAFNTAFANQSCIAFAMDVRLQVRANGLYTYPDGMVVCGEVELVQGRDDTVTNPVVIIEVLSDSTKDYDRGGKFLLYRALPTLQSYILIDQESVLVEHHQKLDERRWLMETYRDLTETLKISAVNLELPLERIYNKVVFNSKQV